MWIINANVFLPDGRFRLSDVRFEENVCAVFEPALDRASDEDALDAKGAYLLPGLIDAHTHGVFGGDFSDGRAEDLANMARFYAAHGVTGLLATTMALSERALHACGRAVSAFTPEPDCAHMLGVHLEGPFLASKKCGAQRADCLLAPDLEFFSRVNASFCGRIRRVTIAPELKNAVPFIRALPPSVRASLGHTAASYDEAAAAFFAGADSLTHLYNAMEPFSARAPGVIGAGMDADAFAELIVDGFHVHPSAVRAAFKLFPGRIALISDSTRCTGLPDGAYTLGGLPIQKRNGRCTRAGTDRPAGSCITVHDALVNAVRFGIPLEDAVSAATATPAKLCRAEDQAGSILPGRRADLVLLEKDLAIGRVFLSGKPVCRP